jgi:phosphoheptose isomerase
MTTEAAKAARARTVKLTQHQCKVLKETLENLSVVDVPQQNAKHIQAIHVVITEQLEK